MHAHYTGIETLLDPNYKSKKSKISLKICSKENMASILMQTGYIMGDNKIIIKNKFPQQYHHVVGKTFSFTPDEANVDDFAEACFWQ